jgi:hypothetical protein
MTSDSNQNVKPLPGRATAPRPASPRTPDTGLGEHGRARTSGAGRSPGAATASPTCRTPCSPLGRTPDRRTYRPARNPPTDPAVSPTHRTPSAPSATAAPARAPARTAPRSGAPRTLSRWRRSESSTHGRLRRPRGSSNPPWQAATPAAARHFTAISPMQDSEEPLFHDVRPTSGLSGGSADPVVRP